MSYDISFKIKVQDIDEYVPLCECCANITYNVRAIITKSTGLEWKNEQNNGFVKDVLGERDIDDILNTPINDSFRDNSLYKAISYNISQQTSEIKNAIRQHRQY